jgi:hypothetical protein
MPIPARLLALIDTFGRNLESYLHPDYKETELRREFPDAQTHLQRDIAATDRAIDQLVYQLYGLTAEEIALVEAATAPAVASTAPTTGLAP